MQSPEISVIVGAQNARNCIAACLGALLPQLEEVNAEVIVVDGSTDGTAEILAANFPTVKLLGGSADALMPELWKQGLDATQGRIVAFTIAHCIPAANWLQVIQQAHAENSAGVGGPIDAPMNGGAWDWAFYFARYSAHLPPSVRAEVRDIAGDNAAYKRADLDSCAEAMQNGFWETVVHVCLREQGKKLINEPAMLVNLAPAGSLREAARVRQQHGRHYGSTRPGNTVVTRLLRTLAAPLIMPVLLWRIYGRVRSGRPDWTGHFWRALPGLLVLVGAWTLGEVSGYIAPKYR